VLGQQVLVNPVGHSEVEGGDGIQQWEATTKEQGDKHVCQKRVHALVDLENTSQILVFIRCLIQLLSCLVADLFAKSSGIRILIFLSTDKSAV